MTTETNMTSTEALAYLTRDEARGWVPCSRYGVDSEDCAPWAIALAEIIEEATGEDAMTPDSLDHLMGLVVNDHDDPESMIREHGTPAHRELLDELEPAV